MGYVPHASAPVGARAVYEFLLRARKPYPERDRAFLFAFDNEEGIKLKIIEE